MYSNYVGVLSGIFTPMVVATFGMLFLQFIMLPVISGISLSILLPIALLIRSFGFTGPRLREAADSFLALAIVLYFVYPLTFVMNYQIISWLYCSNGPVCNPYPQYNGGYQLSSLSASSLFASNTVPANMFGYNLGLASNFYGPLFSGKMSYLGIGNILYGWAAVPNDINTITVALAQYLFEGIVLIALDLAITIGLAIGLQRGISSALSFLGGGSIWG
jgi:nitrate reductase NapE component